MASQVRFSKTGLNRLPASADCSVDETVSYITAMSPLGGVRGMRHIALKVRDIAKAKSFYKNLLGMDVVWEPDPENVYLSSGYDNIALHQVGFLVESIERVQELEEQFRCAGVTIVHPFKIHRDGSASFYCADPDGIVIQMLYEPQLSHKAP